MTNRQINNPNEQMVNSAMAQGYQSQQFLKVASQQKVFKSPSSYMSEETAPPHMILEQKKVKFYSQIEQLKDTRLIENLASLKTKVEKQKCINSFGEIFDGLIKNILEIGDVVKSMRFNDQSQHKANGTAIVQSQLSGQNNNGNNMNVASSVNPNATAVPNNLAANDPKNTLEIAELPDQIIKDCKSIHNIYADLVQDSSLKHLDLCCETFALDGNVINLKFKISTWYTEIKEYVEKNRPVTQSSKNNSNSGGGKGIGSLLCPCFGSKSKPSATNNTIQNNNNINTNNNNNNTNNVIASQNQLGRNNTNQAVQNQRTSQEPNI